jgi:hypothetical protein
MLTSGQIVQGQQVTPVFVGPVSLPASHGVCGTYVFQTFKGTSGEVLKGSVSASSSVNVYVMTATEFQAWQLRLLPGGTCTPANTVASQLDTTSYGLDATMPVTGTYCLVISNLSFSAVTAEITADLV